jgi:hypothetical protein
MTELGQFFSWILFLGSIGVLSYVVTGWIRELFNAMVTDRNSDHMLMAKPTETTFTKQPRKPITCPHCGATTRALPCDYCGGA